MSAPALLRAAHLGPTVAVTTVTGLLSVAAGLSAGRAVLVTAAVLAGQLVIGWSNDLVDAGRDRRTGRTDKPLATGELTTTTVSVALAAAGLAAFSLSLAVGWRSGLLHLVLVVGSGVAYNLGLKRTAWSWLPYALAFGSLPAVVALAAGPPQGAPWWILLAGALLGVGAHFVNVLPDLDDDAATGIRGLPHRLGARRAQLAATGLLGGASLALVLGRWTVRDPAAWAVLAVTAVLAAVAARGSGKTPFRAAMAIALVDVALLTVLR